MPPTVTSTLRFWFLRATTQTLPHNGLRRQGGTQRPQQKRVALPGLSRFTPVNWAVAPAIVGGMSAFRVLRP